MNIEEKILQELRFGFIGNYAVAGMGEPWLAKMAQTHDILRQRGVEGILTLTEDDLYGQHHRDAGFFHLHEPIDDCEPPDAEGMDRAIGFINQCLEKGSGVAVHCFEGRGRTGTVLAAWLAQKESLTAITAIQRIHELRHQTVLTLSQREFLTTYINDKY